MTRRLRDIALLLGSILDAPFAQPHSWTSELVRRNAKRGESPSRRVPCPNCEGEGTVRKRGMRFGCTRCGGSEVGTTGRLWVGHPDLIGDPGRGWIEVDDYTERQVGSDRTEVIVQFKTVHCDVCGGTGVTLAERWRGENNRCERCFGSGRIEMLASHWRSTRMRDEVARSAPAGDAVIDSMEARERSGSFDELAAAMEQLRHEWPSLFRLTCDVFIRGEDVSAEERHAAEAIGLEFLSLRMPDEIKVPAGVRRRAREEAVA